MLSMAMEPPTALEPAPISEEKNKVFRSMEPIQPQDIADTIFWVLNTPAHVNINRLELMPVSQSWAGFAIERGAK